MPTVKGPIGLMLAGGKIVPAGTPIDVDEAEAARLVKYHKFELVEAAEKPPETGAQPPLQKMKNAELLELAKQRGLNPPDTVTREWLLTALKGAPESAAKPGA